MAIPAASARVRKAEPETRERPRVGHAPDPRPTGLYAFKAELDLAELDGRARPIATWHGRGIDICRSDLWFRSRRLCYPDRELLVAVHLVDDQPTPLCGQVARCDYDGDGLYITQLRLKPLPPGELVKQWLLSLHARGGLPVAPSAGRYHPRDDRRAPERGG